MNVLRHDPDCFWLRATPSVDGDEGACCSCGAYADEAEVYALRQQLEGAVEALERIAGVYERTMPGPRDAQRDRVLEIIAAYRATAGGQ